jgi:hypothetical protein
MPRGGEKQLAAAQTDHGQTIATSWYRRRDLSSTGLLPRFGPAAPAITTTGRAHAVGLPHAQATTEGGWKSLGSPELFTSTQQQKDH